MIKRTACVVLSLSIAFVMLLSISHIALGANYPVTGIITTNSIKLRPNPNIGEEGIARLSANLEVVILDEVTAGGEDWYKIQCTVDGKQKTGYILTKYAERGYAVIVFDKSVKIEDIRNGKIEIDESKIGTLPIKGSATVVYLGYGIYNGEYKNGNRSGKGTFVWENGDKYVGQWSNNKMNGDGTLTFINNTVYKGTFKDDSLYEGTATEHQNNGNIIYYMLKSGRASTSVKIVTTKGTTIEGTTKNNAFTGNVTVTYKDGSKYVGPLSNGKKSGNGTYYWPNGAYYSGNWQNDKMNGSGYYYFSKNTKNNYLTGKFKDNLPVNPIIYVWSNGYQYNTYWNSVGKCTSASFLRK